MLRLSLISVMLLLLLSQVAIQEAQADWGLSVVAGVEAGGRLYRAKSDGSSVGWPIPSDDTLAHQGTEALVEMEESFSLGLRVIGRLRDNWGFSAGMSLSDIDVSAKVRTTTADVNSLPWDQVSILHLDAVGTWWPIPGRHEPFIFAGVDLVSLSGEGGTMDQNGVAPVIGAGFSFTLFGNTRLDLSVRDTLLSLDFDDEETRLKDRVIAFGSLEAESSLHLLQLGMGWSFYF